MNKIFNLFRKWWFWLIVIVIVSAIIGSNPNQSNQPATQQLIIQNLNQSQPFPAQPIVPDPIIPPSIPAQITDKDSSPPAPIPVKIPQPIPVPAPTINVAPANQDSSQPAVKKSSTGICHSIGTTYYDRTLIFTPYNSLSDCLASGGRLPKK